VSGRRFSRGAAGLAAVLVVAGVALAVVAARGGDPQTLQERVRSVASSLRCPVCQNLSVADSPSALAGQMRDTIATELEAGKSSGQIRQEFAAAYGEWILLAPPKRGLDLAVWLLPIALLLGGAVLVVLAVRRWTIGSAPDHPADPSVLDPADRRMLDRAIATYPGDGE
jgi:cytochrome c-type biogenesis protein CcmH